MKQMVCSLQANTYVVVLPETTEEVSKILAYCNKNNIKVVPRGQELDWREVRCH